MTIQRRNGHTEVLGYILWRDTAGLVLWNTVYLEWAIKALRDSGKDIDEKLLTHLSPLGWEHINLTGDYIWRQNKQVDQGKFQPLRKFGDA